MKKILIFAIIIGPLFLSACAKKELNESWNENNIKNKSPLRLVKDQTLVDINKIRYFEDWAGVKGKSIFNKKHMQKIMQQLSLHCSYATQSFREARIVKHTKSTWEEVWLFNDPKSFRDDKVSGMTVYVTFDASTNQSQTSFYGKCHTGKGVSFINAQ